MQFPVEMGDPAPWFEAEALGGRPDYAFQTTAGRYIVMLFAPGATAAQWGQVMARVAPYRALLDDNLACLFGIVSNLDAVTEGYVEQSVPGIRHFLDPERRIERLYGASEAIVILLDPMHRLLMRRPMRDIDAVFATLDALGKQAGTNLATPPVLVLKNIFDATLCRELIDYFREHGGQDSGFMRQVGEQTVLVVDHRHKRRADVLVNDNGLRKRARAAIERRLLPEIKKCFQFSVTRMERYVVARYTAEDNGHFRPHRDNTTKGTAHRKFAVTMNLNAEDYDGGELRFPEFGQQTYRAPTGGAVVFSCSLLHEATMVTRGERFAFLPFLYDEEGAVARVENDQFLADGVPRYAKAAAE